LDRGTHDRQIAGPVFPRHCCLGKIIRLGVGVRLRVHFVEFFFIVLSLRRAVSVERYGLGIGIVGLLVEWGIIFCGRICKVLLVYEPEKGLELPDGWSTILSLCRVELFGILR
jgi:hypothetical protein